MSEFEAELGSLIGDMRFDKIQQTGSLNTNYEVEKDINLHKMHTLQKAIFEQQ